MEDKGAFLKEMGCLTIFWNGKFQTENLPHLPIIPHNAPKPHLFTETDWLDANGGGLKTIHRTRLLGEQDKDNGAKFPHPRLPGSLAHDKTN